MEITIFALYFIISLFMVVAFLPMILQAPIPNAIFAVIIIILTAPILLADYIIEKILGMFLPEGWNDDDDDSY
jgi:hypothetical protein